MSKSNEGKFDKRTIERSLKTGEVSKEEYEQYLNSLEDYSDNVQNMETKFVYYTEKSKSESKSEDK